MGRLADEIMREIPGAIVDEFTSMRVPDHLLGESRDESEESGFELGIRCGMDWEWKALAGFMDSVTKKKFVNITEESAESVLSYLLPGRPNPELRDIVFVTPFTYGYIEGLKRSYDEKVALKGG